MRTRLAKVSLAELRAQELERLANLDLSGAIKEMLQSVEGLAEREADRLEIPFVDPMYHGCDSAWRRLLLAKADLQYVVERAAESRRWRKRKP